MLTTEEFIRRAVEIHGNQYDYSKVIYTGCNDKVEIICPKHGSFMQSLRLHIHRKNGCLECSKSKAKRELIPKEVFLERAKEIHGEKYDYSDINYTSYSNDPITIRCPRHGEFTLNRTYLHITNKNGCPKCAVRADTAHFIKTATEKHGDRYSYDLSIYETIDTPLIIGCPEHGQQLITPGEHYRVGCWFCKRNRSQDIWLDEIGIPNDKQSRQVRIQIDGKLFVVDGMKDGVIYLFHGDYWHGNPALYAADATNTRMLKTFGELFINTVNYENSLRTAGYDVVSIWENDWLQKKGKK